MRRAIALLLLLLVAAVAVVLLLRPARSGPGPAPAPDIPQHEAPVSGSPSTHAPSTAHASPAVAAIPGMTTAAFNHRLRCVDVRQLYGRVASTDVVALLCQRKPLAALAIEVPLAEAGDVHAMAVLGLIANNGGCNAAPPPSFARFRTRMIERARENGASAETVRRLDGWLAEEEQGRTPDEVAACRQATDATKKLRPEFMSQVAGVLGHPLDPGRDTGPDTEIEYRRKTLADGDSEGAEELAEALLSKGTPASQAEAMVLLRDAARTSASAKVQLAQCLLSGCPTPAADPDEAVQLLTAAAAEGDWRALRTLAGALPENQQPGNDTLLPAADRYAWSQLLHELNEEGCFGASIFTVWATGLAESPTLTAMSPADAAAAQTRADELLGAQLEQTRSRLGCN